MTGFIYAVAAESLGHVKIGWSTKPFRRLVKIKSDCPVPVRLLGIIAATKEQERKVHAMLDEWRKNGEWFQLQGLVVTFVGMLQSIAPPKPKIESNFPLCKFRRKHSMTQQKLADLLGVTFVTVSRWETGERKIAVDYLDRITQKTGIAPGDLRPDLRDKLKVSA